MIKLHDDENAVQPPLGIPDENGKTPHAWVYFQLTPRDTGQNYDRKSTAEYVTRKPHCVESFDLNGINLYVSNAGPVISDLIVVEYQIVYCSSPAHGPGDGFSATHSGEVLSDPMNKLSTLASVPPRSSIKIRIPIPQVDVSWLENLYFRARVTTLWERPVPKPLWNFENDPRVTEAYLQVGKSLYTNLTVLRPVGWRSID